MKLTSEQQSEIAIYSPLSEGLSQQIQRVIDGKMTSASVTFFETGFDPDPYVQVGLPAANSDITLEVISNTYLNDKLNSWQVSKLQSIGWNLPTATNPNFWIRTSPTDTYELSQVFVYSVQSAFGITPETWFSFGTAPLDMAMNGSSLFWRKRGQTGVVCLPGQNIDEAIEGKL